MKNCQANKRSIRYLIFIKKKSQPKDNFKIFYSFSSQLHCLTVKDNNKSIDVKCITNRYLHWCATILSGASAMHEDFMLVSSS